MDNLKGQVIRGYELQELVGEGGFGAVYRAMQTVVSREVGIKIILPQYANEPEFIRRFEAEAQLIARLEHLHIVPLYDYWRDPSGAYLVMRYLRGGTLRQALSDKGAWSAKATARLLSQIGAALTVAHRNNVVHRDVKPSNILLDEDKNAYLSDFGIATQQVSANKTTSSSGRVTGSAGYISPEQINLEAVSSRTDVYAMSIILYEMLTGAHPYADAKSPMALFIKHVNEPLPPMFGVPQEVQEVVFKGASKDPNQRYGDLLEMANAFRQAITETGFIGLHHDPEAVEEFDSSSFDLTPTPTSIVAQNPYKGLRAFQESDAGDFFGREALTKQLLKRMDEDTPYYRFLAVVGPSGSGKSSVVKAGVIPALRQNAIEGANEWFIAEMTPGVSPFDELTQAFASISTTELPNLRDFIAKPDSGGLNALLKLILPTRTSELLLVIDQFEEAFTQGNDSERTLFLNALQDAVTALDSRLRVIVTLRADFYDRPLMVQNFSQLMQQRTEVVIPLTADELERAITAPARQVKVFFQQGLSALIVSEVNEQPGVLPMLQYALTELFERREGALLTLRAYQDIGGVLGALARRAEEIYTQLNGDEREATRQLFLRLVTLGEGTEDTRRRALQSEIIAASETPAVMQAVIESFGNYRLLTYDRDPITRTPTVEVAHEALIREWQRLREWLDESREDIRLQRLLSNATNEWQEANRDPSFLLRGGRLIQFEEWAKTSAIAISQQERDYLSASIAERERQEARERERQRNELELERRAKQRARLIIAILSVAFVGGILLSVFAFNQSQVAQTQANIANTQVAIAATAQQEAVLQAGTAVSAQGEAQAQADIANTQVVIVALAQQEALDQAATATNAQGQAQAQADIANTQVAIAATARQDAVLQASTAVSAQGEAQAQADIANTQVAIAATARQDAVLQASTAVSAQGEAQAQADIANTQVAIAATARQDAVLQASTAVSAQGEAQAQADIANTQVAIAATAQQDTLNQANIANTQVAIAATARQDAVLQASTAVSAQSEAQRQAQASQSLALAANASQLQTSNSALALALALEANNVPNPSLQAQRVLLSVVYNAPRRFLNNGVGINDAVSAGALLYTANADGSISIWNMSSGEQEALLKDQQTDAIRALALSPDGRLLASGSTNGTITLWDTETRQMVSTLSGHNGSVNSLAFNPTNRNQLASGGSDASTLLWNVTNGRLTRTLTSESRNAVNSVAYSPNGTSLLIISDDAMRLFSFANNAFLDFENSPSRVRAGVFSPDGTRILISGSASSSTPQLWDVARRRLLRNLSAHDAPVNSVLFSPTGEQVLSVSDDFTAILSDADTGDELRRFAAHNNRVTQAIFADDGLGVFTVSTSGEIYQWDTTQASETRTFARQTNAITSIGRVLYSPNGRYIISAVDDGTVLIWEGTSEQPMTRSFGRTSIPQTRLVLSPEATDDNLLAFWGATDVRLVNLTTGDTLRTFAVDESRAFVESIAVSPDGKTMAWAGGAFFRRSASEFTRAGILTVWNVQTGARRLTLDDHNLRDTDGNLIEGINRAVTAVAISPDGRYMVSGAENGVVYLWDLTTGARLREFIGHADRITHAVFSTNGTQFLTSAADRVAILWNVADGQILRRFSGHRGAVNFAAFNADNTLVVTGAQDSRIIVWDVETGQSLQQFLVGDAPITSVAFSPDSQFVLSGAINGKTTLWRIETPQQLREWTRTNRYIPEFTCSQRAQFGLPSCDASGNPPPPPPN
jgi:WD40 repeat protein/serine/threonine protein kinase